MKSNRLALPLFALLCALVTFIACTKYKDTTPATTDLPADKTVVTSIQGRILDENGVPVTGAVVSGGGKDTTTDVNGAFSFKDIQVSSRFGYVKVTMPGYFPGGRSVITNAAGMNYVTISLIPRASKGSFAASTGGTVVVQTGDTVVFDPSSFVVDANKVAYTGSVHVFASYLDPNDVNLSQIMPGDLRGIGADGKETALQTFGMMAVELEGDAGEKLQLAPGKTAAITMPIPASLQATTPASMPLWYFNDTTGKWIQQGTATKKGNSLCGTTSHFTFWNCDIGTGVVNFKVHLIDTHGNPLVYTPIQFVTQTAGARGGFTDATGSAQGLIPQGQSLVFQVLNPCGTVAFGENLGPVLSDQDLGTLTVTMDTAELTLTGTVVDCSNNPVASGFVNVVLEGLTYRGSVSKGAFSMNIIRCSGSTATAELTATDYATQQNGKPVSLTVKSGSQDAGQLTACGISVDQFINVTINGNTYDWGNPPDNFVFQSTSSTSIDAYRAGNTAGNFSLYLAPPITSTGTFDVTFFNMRSGNEHYSAQPGTMKCNVTTFGAVNEYIVGTWSGTVLDSTTFVTYPITGSLKVKRTE